MDAANGDVKPPAPPPPNPAPTTSSSSRANRFRLFTRESLAKIAKRQQEDKVAKELLKEKQKDKKEKEEEDDEDKPRPNPALQQGMSLPKKMADFPPDMFGIPIEDIDEFYDNKYTFVVVARDKTIFRFSSSNGFFLLSPWNPIRRAALLVLTHPLFSLLVMLVILVNCVFMAINKEIPHTETIFTTIYTVEGTVKMLSRGFILADFTYLRDAWNWLDFIVVSSAYLTMAIGETGGKVAVLRTFRVFRALKTVAVVPGLKTIVGALMEAVRRLRDVMILSLFVLSIFALIGLQLYQGKLSNKCIRIYENLTESEFKDLPDELKRSYVKNSSNWQDYPDNVDGKICGGSLCAEGFFCTESYINPNYGYTHYDNFGVALLCAFRLMTQDYWENLYQLTIKANGPGHMLFFIIVIFLGSFYLVNLILAIVAMSYDDCRKQDADAEANEQKELEEDARAAALEAEADEAEALLLLGQGSVISDPNQLMEALQKSEVASMRSAGSSRKRSDVNVNSTFDMKSPSSHPGSPSLALHRGSQFSWRYQPPVPPPSYSPQPFYDSYQSPAPSHGGPFVLPCLENLDLPFADDSAAVTPTSEDICAFQNVRNAYLTSRTGFRSSMTLISAGSGMGLYQQQPNRMVQLETRFATSRQSGHVTTQPYAQSPKLLGTPTSLMPGDMLSNRIRLPDFRRTEPTHFHWVSGRSRNLNSNLATGAGIIIGKTKDDFDKNKLNDTAFAYRTPSATTIDMKDVQVLKDLIKEASKKKNFFGMEEGQTKKEFFKAKCHQLLFGWECCPCWYKFARIIELFIMDAFVDLFITLCIVINTLFMAMDHDNMSQQLTYTLKYGNYVFTCIFTIEAVFKILALGLYKYLEDKWSCFDIVIVILSLVELGLSGVKGLSILRSFRLLRVFKLAKSWPTLNLLIGIIGRTMGALGNLCFVLAIIVFIFAVMGMQLFGNNYNEEFFPKPDMGWHFKDFLHAFMIVFRVLCGEWIESMWDCMYCSGTPCVPFFLLTMIIGNLVVLNLFLALLLSSFGAESLKHSEEEEGPNKLQEAIDRITRFCIYVKSHLSYCVKKHKPHLMSEELQESKMLGPYQQTEPGENGGLYQAYDCSSPPPDMKKTNSTEENKLQMGNHHHACTHQPKSQKSFDDASSVTSTVTSSTEGEGSEKSMLSKFSYSYDDATSTARTGDGPEIHEVKVVFIKYPDECCPKCYTQKCGGLVEAFDRTTLGKIWGAYRFFMFRLVENSYFETFIILMIVLSSLALAVEDVYIETESRWLLKLILKVMDKVFTVIFVFEMIIKQSAYGFKKYFTDAWCWLDFVIVVISLLSLGAESLGYGNIGAFRALRTLRALRPLRAVSRWEGMKVVVNALIQAIPSIFNVLLVCLVFWLIFSIMGVNLFGGKYYECRDSDNKRVNASIVPNKTVCLELKRSHNFTWFNPKINFDNVLVGYLALFQVATFKGWIDIMNSAINSQSEDEAQPEFEKRSGMYLYFVFFIVFGSFFTLNLFIGVIIENFNMQKKKAGGSLEMLMTEDQKKYYNAMKKLGSKQPQKPIPKPKAKFQLVLFYITSSQKFDILIMLFILLNMMTMAIEHFDQSLELEHTLSWVNNVFVIVFTLECVMKLFSLRQYYFKQPWNVFDFVVVISSALTSIMSDKLKDLPISPTLLRVVRVFRVGRILRLVKSAKGIRTLLFSLAVSMPALFNIGLLLFLVMFIFSIFGMSFFMHVKHTNGLDDMFNFETFFRSMIILFQISTSAGWAEVLAGLMNEEDCDNSTSDTKPNGDCGSSGEAVVFLVSYLVISFLVVINMYIAVILENFSQATEDVQQGLTQDDFDMYYEIWERYDENATQYINLSELTRFVDELEEPLRLPAPNYFKLVSLDITICDNDRVHCVDILDALTKNYLGTGEVTDEIGDIKKGPDRKDYNPISSLIKRQREIFSARVIQSAWKKYRTKKFGKSYEEEFGKPAEDGNADDQAPPLSLPAPDIPTLYLTPPVAIKKEGDKGTKGDGSMADLIDI